MMFIYRLCRWYRFRCESVRWSDEDKPPWENTRKKPREKLNLREFWFCWECDYSHTVHMCKVKTKRTNRVCVQDVQYEPIVSFTHYFKPPTWKNKINPNTYTPHPPPRLWFLCGNRLTSEFSKSTWLLSASAGNTTALLIWKWDTLYSASGLSYRQVFLLNL